jgi:Leucine-rich repeat (LRR) protein
VTILITYLTAKNTQEQINLDKEIEEIDLSSREIANIDLSPLKECVNLEEIDLYNNNLQTIDLSPLSAVSNLTKLNLSKNQIETIDLGPLSKCSKLKELDLMINQLRAIDLSPLRECPQLEILRLKMNYLRKETVVPIFSRVDKDLIAQINSTYVIPADPNVREMVVTTNSKNIDYSGLANCMHLEEIKIQQCENVESIDLTSLSKNQTLRVIEIWGNRPFRELLLPTGCDNLEHVVIMGNTLRPTKPTDDEKTIRISESRETSNAGSRLKIDGHEVQPSTPYDMTPGSSGVLMITIDGAPTIQRLEITRTEWEAQYFSCLVDLSVLDNSPNLRVIDIQEHGGWHVIGKRNLKGADHEIFWPHDFSIILPSNCPNLMALSLGDTTVEEWRLENCPNLRYITVRNRRDGFDFGQFLDQYQTRMTRPIIYIDYGYLDESVGFNVHGFDLFPQEIKECFVSKYVYKKNYEDEMRRCEKGSFPMDTADWLEKGREALCSGKLHYAINAFNQAASLTPSSFDAWWELGRACNAYGSEIGRTGDHSRANMYMIEAAFSFDRAARADPNDPNAEKAKAYAQKIREVQKKKKERGLFE